MQRSQTTHEHSADEYVVLTTVSGDLQPPIDADFPWYVGHNLDYRCLDDAWSAYVTAVTSLWLDLLGWAAIFLFSWLYQRSAAPRRHPLR